MAAHEFALYYSALSSLTGTIGAITDKALVHHLRVLRVRAGDQIILFNERMHARIAVKDVQREKIVIEIYKREPNEIIVPPLHVALGLPKKPALEDIVYALTELGATSLQLLNSIQRPWGGEREYSRLQALMIAAAQQSKQFILPQIYEPIDVVDYLAKKTSASMFLCDAHASTSLFQHMCLTEKTPQEIVLFIGSESDFTDQEKEAILSSGAQSCYLLPTILRSSQAVNVAVSIIRSKWAFKIQRL